jgi:hypothetical protein
VVQLVLLPGLDGTGLLFRPLVATLFDAGTKVVSYPNDKALSFDEHAQARHDRLVPASAAQWLRDRQIARVRATHF